MSTPPKGVPTGNDDSDPTGMRVVLSSLPDPGPMPEDLATRICASLEREQGRRTQNDALQQQDSRADAAGDADKHNMHSQRIQNHTSDTHTSDTLGFPGHGSSERGQRGQGWLGAQPVHDLASERTRRRPQQWILAAAAVLAVGVIGTVVFDQVLSSDSGASDVAGAVPSPQDGSSDGGAAINEDTNNSNTNNPDANNPEENNAERDKQGTDQKNDRSEGASIADTQRRGPDQLEGSGEVVRSLDDDVFASGAKSLLQVAAGQTSAQVAPVPETLSLTLTDVQPLASTELNNCVSATGGQPARGSWVGTPAVIDGEAVVVVGDLDSQDPQAWALDDSCPADPAADVLMGPVSLP